MDLTPAQENAAQALHREATVVDGLVLPYNFEPKYLDMCQRGGLNIAFMTLVGRTPPHDAFFKAVQRIDDYRRLVAANPDRLIIIEDAAGLHEAKETGKLGLVLSLQSSNAFEADLGLLRTLYRLGARVLGLTYNDSNPVGSGAGEARDDGLSRLGHDVVREANELGLVLDLAHCGDQTVADTIELSQSPIISSHSSVRALCDNRRNRTDAHIRALAEKGGVIGICPFPTFLQWGERPTLDDFVDHVEYVAKNFGPDHVGIGLDLETKYTDDGVHPPVLNDWPELYGPPGEHGWPYPVGLEDHEEGLPNITRGLVARGHDEEDITKILGGNLIRVLQQVWR